MKDWPDNNALQAMSQNLRDLVYAMKPKIAWQEFVVIAFGY